MKYKYQLLKASWGIVIYLNVDEILNGDKLESDILIAHRVYLRLDDSIQWYTKDIALKYISAGLKDLTDLIKMRVPESTVCFHVKSIDYNEAHFQEEGLYCAIQEWISQYYKLEINPIMVEFDNRQNRYVFNF